MSEEKVLALGSVRFLREKETKNTIRFAEQPPEGQPPVIGTLYVQKWFAEDAEELLLTIRKVSNG